MKNTPLARRKVQTTRPHEVLSCTSSTCAVCMSPIRKRGMHVVEAADCGHTFHLQCLMTSRGHNNTACPLCRHTLAPGLTPLVAKAAATAAAAAAAAPESVEAVPESVELSAVRSAELQLAIDAAMDGDLSF